MGKNIETENNKRFNTISALISPKLLCNADNCINSYTIFNKIAQYRHYRYIFKIGGN